MPFIDREYRLPTCKSGRTPDPLACTFIRLRMYHWNVLAYEHDGRVDKASQWAAKATGAAATLVALLGDEEASLAIADAKRKAAEEFDADLRSAPMNEQDLLSGAHDTPVFRWRGRRGQEPVFR